jgi:hypothetical protein
MSRSIRGRTPQSGTRHRLKITELKTNRLFGLCQSHSILATEASRSPMDPRERGVSGVSTERDRDPMERFHVPLLETRIDPFVRADTHPVTPRDRRRRYRRLESGASNPEAQRGIWRKLKAVSGFRFPSRDRGRKAGKRGADASALRRMAISPDRRYLQKWILTFNWLPMRWSQTHVRGADP